jgi:site-specific DNA-methyltransferase (adenine-specific)
MRANINLHHGDCIDAMKGMEDNQFDLAIVDPPYGHGKQIINNNKSRNKLAIAKDYGAGEWNNNRPKPEYWKQLFRVSKHQIVWGGNYFAMSASQCWIVWDKDNGKNDFADCELAWTNFDSAVRKVTITWHGMLQESMSNKEKRIHPTQKPKLLYKWLLQNYAKEGDKILDTHLGSGSIAIACWDLKYDLTGYELDEEYYNAACKRFETHCKQGQLF